MKATAFGIQFEQGITNSIGIDSEVTPQEAAKAFGDQFGYDSDYFDTIFILVNGSEGPEVKEHWELGKHF